MRVVFVPVVPRAACIARLSLPAIGVLLIVVAYFVANTDRVLFVALVLASMGCLGTGFALTLQTKKIEFLDDRWVEYHYNFLQKTTYYRDVLQIGTVNIRATNGNLAFYNLENQYEWEAMVAHLGQSGRLPQSVVDLTRSE